MISAEAALVTAKKSKIWQVSSSNQPDVRPRSTFRLLTSMAAAPDLPRRAKGKKSVKYGYPFRQSKVVSPAAAFGAGRPAETSSAVRWTRALGP